jgi:salicylate hydroxylase
LIYGKTLLIGDAGHPMTPFTAQGATQALEDAGALLGLFSNISSKDQLSSRLQMFEKVRLARSARVQSSASTPLRSGKPNPLVERKQEYQDRDKMFLKGLEDKERALWDFG